MMFFSERVRSTLLVSMFSAIALATTAPLHAATLTVINNDSAGEGFNDPTTVAPVGGNSGTTLGAQRLNTFQAAANVWGSLLASSVTIKVGAQFNPLTCSATSALLGQAGPANFFRDFTGAPLASTWYPSALASALHGSDMDPGNPAITATFSSTVGTSGCPFTWYYGLDGNPPSGQFDLFSVVLHELGHGLGFLTLVDLTTGAKAGGFNDTFMLNLENHGASPPDYPSMSDAQRVAASTATGNLHWVGAHVEAASGLLSAGTVGSHVRMFAPNPQQPGSSVSHWDTVLTPNQLMEPVYTQPLHGPVLELPLFRDIGWTLSPSVRTATHDFNNDGTSDILWRQSGSGVLAMWMMSGGHFSSGSNVSTVPSVWSVAGTRDFNGDGKADILWQDTSGDVAVWLMNGSALSSGISVGTISTQWKVAGTGDFNGNGSGDILWRNTSTGDVAIWLMNNGQFSSGVDLGIISGVWQVVGAGDFNGDGTTDILWRNTTTGDLTIWLMQNGQFFSGVDLGAVSLTWTVVGTSDFNGDGTSDILWRDSSGNVAIWLMSSAHLSSGATLGQVSTAWSVVETGDFNGDGKSDILWLDSAGDLAVWLMNGTSLSSGVSLGNVGTSWSVQGANAD